MATKKTEAGPYEVPPLTSHTPYAALIAKRDELTALHVDLKRRRKAAEAAFRTNPAPSYRAGVAELLGEKVEGMTSRAEVAELIRQENDAADALAVLEQRIRTARGPASVHVCDQVRPEFSRRVASLCRALETLSAERAAYHELTDRLEAEDIAWSYLGPVSLLFLGDRHDGHVHRFLREAREAGHVR